MDDYSPDAGYSVKIKSNNIDDNNHYINNNSENNNYGGLAPSNYYPSMEEVEEVKQSERDQLNLSKNYPNNQV